MPSYLPLSGSQGSKGLERGIGLLAGRKQPRDIRAHERDSGDPRELAFALQYLDAFGYLKNGLADNDKIGLPEITTAINAFQLRFGLAKTGRICTRTVRTMETPRCGCPDIVRPRHTQYKAIQAWARAMLPAWRKRSLLYAVANYLPTLKTADQDLVHGAAFASWTRLGNIDVQRVSDPAQADIVLSTGEGPRSNFDGPGGVLAWAYLPDGNDQQLLMEFDLGESWVLGAQDPGIVMINVATHEFGHLFGLSHSTVNSALMAPIYNVAIATPQVNDDIGRFQARYGVRTPAADPAPASPPTAPATPTPAPTPAPTGGDAVRVAIEGNAFVWLNNKLVS